MQIVNHYFPSLRKWDHHLATIQMKLLPTWIVVDGEGSMILRLRGMGMQSPNQSRGIPVELEFLVRWLF